MLYTISLSQDDLLPKSSYDLSHHFSDAFHTSIATNHYVYVSESKSFMMVHAHILLWLQMHGGWWIWAQHILSRGLYCITDKTAVVSAIRLNN